jgi:hypothetical protein
MILVALALAVAPANPHAGEAYVQGLGNLSCGRWTAEQPSEPHSMMRVALITWLGGYISGYNFRRGGNVLEGTDWDGALGWVDRYCAGHPLDTVSTAAGGLIIELNERRIQGH